MTTTPSDNSDEDDQARDLSLEELEAALDDEDHPLHEAAKRANRQIGTNLSGAWVDMMSTINPKLLDFGSETSEILKGLTASKFTPPAWAIPETTALAQYDLSAIEIAGDPTPSLIEELIETTQQHMRATNEVSARILIAAEQTSRESARDAKKSRMIAWFGIGIAVLAALGSIAVSIALAG